MSCSLASSTPAAGLYDEAKLLFEAVLPVEDVTNLDDRIARKKIEESKNKSWKNSIWESSGLEYEKKSRKGYRNSLVQKLQKMIDFSKTCRGPKKEDLLRKKHLVQ